MAKRRSAKNGNGANLGFEEKLWAAADKLRGHMDAGKYEDIPGFCKSASLEEIESHGYVLTPGRYVGAEEAEDDDGMPFEERMEQLTAKLKSQFAESAKLEKAILNNLASLGFTGKQQL